MKYINDDDANDNNNRTQFFANHAGHQVILKAAHAVASRFCSLRVCTVLLNILNCLLDVGVVISERSLSSVDEKSEDSSSGPKSHQDDRKRDVDSTTKVLVPEDEDQSTFAVALETVFR